MDPIIVITKYSMNHLWRTVTAVLLKFYENFCANFCKKKFKIFYLCPINASTFKIVEFWEFLEFFNISSFSIDATRGRLWKSVENFNQLGLVSPLWNASSEHSPFYLEFFADLRRFFCVTENYRFATSDREISADSDHVIFNFQKFFYKLKFWILVFSDSYTDIL